MDATVHQAHYIYKLRFRTGNFHVSFILILYLMSVYACTTETSRIIFFSGGTLQSSSYILVSSKNAQLYRTIDQINFFLIYSVIKIGMTLIILPEKYMPMRV